MHPTTSGADGSASSGRNVSSSRRAPTGEQAHPAQQQQVRTPARAPAGPVGQPFARLAQSTVTTRPCGNVARNWLTSSVLLPTPGSPISRWLRPCRMLATTSSRARRYGDSSSRLARIRASACSRRVAAQVLGVVAAGHRRDVRPLPARRLGQPRRCGGPRRARSRSARHRAGPRRAPPPHIRRTAGPRACRRTREHQAREQQVAQHALVGASAAGRRCSSARSRHRWPAPTRRRLTAAPGEAFEDLRPAGSPAIRSATCRASIRASGSCNAVRSDSWQTTVTIPHARRCAGDPRRRLAQAHQLRGVVLGTGQRDGLPVARATDIAVVPTAGSAYP